MSENKPQPFNEAEREANRKIARRVEQKKSGRATYDDSVFTHLVFGYEATCVELESQLAEVTAERDAAREELWSTRNQLNDALRRLDWATKRMGT